MLHMLVSKRKWKKKKPVKMQRGTLDRVLEQTQGTSEKLLLNFDKGPLVCDVLQRGETG